MKVYSFSFHILKTHSHEIFPTTYRNSFDFFSFEANYNLVLSALMQMQVSSKCFSLRSDGIKEMQEPILLLEMLCDL